MDYLNVILLVLVSGCANCAKVQTYHQLQEDEIDRLINPLDPGNFAEESLQAKHVNTKSVYLLPSVRPKIKHCNSGETYVNGECLKEISVPTTAKYSDLEAILNFLYKKKNNGPNQRRPLRRQQNRNKGHNNHRTTTQRGDDEDESIRFRASSTTTTSMPIKSTLATSVSTNAPRQTTSKVVDGVRDADGDRITKADHVPHLISSTTGATIENLRPNVVGKPILETTAPPQQYLKSQEIGEEILLNKQTGTGTSEVHRPSSPLHQSPSHHYSSTDSDSTNSKNKKEPEVARDFIQSPPPPPSVTIFSIHSPPPLHHNYNYFNSSTSNNNNNTAAVIMRRNQNRRTTANVNINANKPEQMHKNN